MTCENRFPACHDVCKPYKEWASKRQEAATQRRNEAEVTDAIISGKLRVAR